MPEKPEVITVVKSLIPRVVGKRITDCCVYWNNIIEYPYTDQFKKKIINQRINSIDTRGKWIVFSLDDYKLLVHLRMEGKFFFRDKDDVINKHDHVVFILDNSISFRFNDVRKFGKMYLLENDVVNSVKPLCNIGLEYYDLNLNDKYLYNKIHNSNKPIKTLLLDQSIIAGIGNIYVDEILFCSRINPLKKGCDVSIKECNKIVKYTKEVLDKALKLGGTTIKSFTSSEGVHGLFQNELLIHGKKNQKCIKCGSDINFIRVNTRGTYFCPKCQK